MSSEVLNAIIVFCSVVSLALVLNFFLFSKQPVSKSVAVLMAVGLCVVLGVIKLQLKKNNSDFGGLFAYPIGFYFILKKKKKESLNQFDSPSKEHLESTAVIPSTNLKISSCFTCGTENQPEALFCQKCGNSVSGVTAQPKPIVKLQDTGLAIWNPNSAAIWSCFLSPAFGAYLQMLNWRALGEPEKAASSKKWFYVSVVILAVIWLIIGEEAFKMEELGVDPPSMDAPATVGEFAIQLIWFLFMLVWYFSAGRAQSKYVKEKFGSTYARKPWRKALAIGFAAFFGSFLAVIVALSLVSVVAS